MLKYSTEMYLKEILASSTYWLVLALLLGTEYFAITQYKEDLAFVEVLQFIAIPVYIFLVAVPFFTEDRVLTFELVMFRDWLTVPLARMLSLLIALLPFLLTTIGIAWGMNEQPFALPILASTLFYASLVLLITVFGGGGKVYILSMGALFMLPFSSLVLIQNQASMGNTVGGLIGYLTYIMSPVYGLHVHNSGVLTISASAGNDVTFLLSAVWMILYLLISQVRNVKPSG
ncbi:hypothetical protein A3L09_07045 [Thermococcus profundus]|uniref:Uncharacterized protein n=1 Tax=Thermococcus profundus TaxID=49899 RepID=A0A2Z2MC18_THEPR|nr:hypothetical protein [Thermococcus profundus]ASJ03029.1 hypothetical protein A3L09_07045 [Thermococcus profundus]